MRKTGFWLLSFLILLGFGCGGTDDSGGNRFDGPVTYYKDIKPIVDAHCVGCHSEGNIAPFSLDTYDGVRLRATLVHREVVERRMPPWGLKQGIREYLDDISLSPAQIELISRWVDEGTPEGDPADEGAPIDLGLRTLERVDVEIPMKEPYEPDVSRPDDYRCFVLEWPEQERKYITGFRGVPGNLNSAHHLVAFIVPPHAAEQVDAYEDLDEGPGYRCFGTPDPEALDLPSTQSAVYYFGGHWAPGNSGNPLAPGTGQPIEPGSRIVLGMHYNTVNEGVLTDHSAIQFMLEDEVDTVGYYVAWMSINWPTAPATMTIPGGETGVSHLHRSRVQDSPVVGFLAPELDVTRPLEVHAVYPHMHTLGRQLSLKVHHTDDTFSEEPMETVVHVEDYAFDWQREFVLAEPVQIGADDELEVECIWDNTREQRIKGGVLDPDPSDVLWGEGSGDEMCVALMYVTEL